jgi:hypothetical protein
MVPFACVTIRRHPLWPTALISQRTLSEPTMKKFTIARHHRKAGADMYLPAAAQIGAGGVRRRHNRDGSNRAEGPRLTQQGAF